MYVRMSRNVLLVWNEIWSGIHILVPVPVPGIHYSTVLQVLGKLYLSLNRICCCNFNWSSIWWILSKPLSLTQNLRFLRFYSFKYVNCVVLPILFKEEAIVEHVQCSKRIWWHLMNYCWTYSILKRIWWHLMNYCWTYSMIKENMMDILWTIV